MQRNKLLAVFEAVHSTKRIRWLCPTSDAEVHVYAKYNIFIEFNKIITYEYKFASRRILMIE